MGRAKYVVELAEEERVRLRSLLRGGKASVRMVTRARVLLKADEGYTDGAIAAALEVATATVGRIRKRLVEEGLEHALREQPRPGQRRKLSGKQEAHVIAVACSTPPEGRGRWTLRLLARKVVELGFAPSISPETVRQMLKKNELKPWQREEWCIPAVSAEFVAAMEDVLDLYEEPYDPQRPTVCFDETSTQLIGESRIPLPARPGRRERFDYEYRRNGTRNLFMLCEPLRGWRHVAVTERRRMGDFAHQMRWLADEAYTKAEKIRVVLDNLNTHRPASLYETFDPAEARRILKRLEFHYTPKHGSWLNMAEIELSVFSRQCLNRRIPDGATLTRELAALVRRRNEAHATIAWRFTTSAARTTLRHLYPTQQNHLD